MDRFANNGQQSAIPVAKLPDEKEDCPRKQVSGIVGAERKAVVAARLFSYYRWVIDA